jgi:hypothetical protein
MIVVVVVVVTVVMTVTVTVIVRVTTVRHDPAFRFRVPALREREAAARAGDSHGS